ncbi:MAG TPA: hypothetical protein VN655_11460 [Pseudolabrys sp.]|nr:hypothetical protein [Pseudolabrys sp.]
MVRKLRTAVLVVHGMGSQRPLDTVRGVINAVWFDNDDHSQDKVHKLWSHPEPSGVDLDLTVMTTNEIAATSGERSADFHELYWAHLMSETKAVAVLLWLFELGRRGPKLKTGMNGLWWAGAIYLNLLLLSVALLVMQAVVWLTCIDQDPQKIAYVVGLMLAIAVLAGLFAALRHKYWKLSIALLIILGAMLVAGYWIFTNDQVVVARLTSAFIAPALAFLAATLLMKSWGRITFAATYGLSLVFFAIVLCRRHPAEFFVSVADHFKNADLPWGLPSQQSTIAAFCIIGVYLLMNAAFLQPYLGDAARYFRNSPANVAVRREIRKEAVKTLDQLHRSRDYDRIVVVAHSLGTVVAYDMLRAYYSRICDQIPVDRRELDPEFDHVDRGLPTMESARSEGRALIRKFAAASAMLAPAARVDPYKPVKSEEVDAWLVTDFVTLGSPLTHARYFMTNDDNGDRLDQDFEDQVRERALPTCPPKQLDNDGLIAFTNAEKKTRLHHGGMFGMTRWTNLFFPINSIFWGDAIGGLVHEIFGKYVKDVPVSTRTDNGTRFFAHVAYWQTDCPEGRRAPHLASLIAAINLADT